MKSSAPTSPPPSDRLAAHKDKVEARRQVSFEVWKAALEAANGCVTHAAVATWPEIAEGEKRRARSRGNMMTRRLGLVKYARELRLAAWGRDVGRMDGGTR